MNEWLQKAGDLVVQILGVGHSSGERVVIAFLGIAAFLLVFKLFTKEGGRGDVAWMLRFLSTIVILFTVIFGVIVADKFVIPYVSNDVVQKITLVVVPVLLLVVFVAPLLMLVLKKGYGSMLVTIGASIFAGIIVLFTVSFIIDSFTGSDKEFKRLKRRTHDIDEFINQ